MTRILIKALTLMISITAGCGVSPLVQVPNLEVPRTEPVVLLPAPVSVRPATQHIITIAANYENQNDWLSYAAVRMAQGSQCHVSALPWCGDQGTCQVGVSVAGDVCVLLVRGVSTLGLAFDPYCHDLSHPDLKDQPELARGERHPAWESCLEDAQRIVEFQRGEF